MSIELKIKYLTLATEAQLIRSERRRLKSQNQQITNITKGIEYRILKLKGKLTRMRKHIEFSALGESVLKQVRAKYSSRYAQLIRLRLLDVPTKAPSLVKTLENQKQANIYTMNNIQAHKNEVVRTAARSTHLARNFLKGTPYQDVESKLKKNTSTPDFKAIEAMVKKYGKGDERTLMQKFSQWIDEANSWITRLDSVSA